VVGGWGGQMALTSQHVAALLPAVQALVRLELHDCNGSVTDGDLAAVCEAGAKLCVFLVKRAGGALASIRLVDGRLVATPHVP
jgi:hypothetical protein